MLFWILTGVSLIIVATVMGVIAWHAREVPDKAHQEKRFRYNPEIIRILAYSVVVLICLLAAIYELSLYHEDEEDEADPQAQVEAPPSSTP